MSCELIMSRFSSEIEKAYPVPAHVQACASAIRYDLMHGPSYSAIPSEGMEKFTIDHYATFADDLADIEGATIEETYVGQVAETLRTFIESLPSELWYDDDCECLMDSEPEGEQDEETGEWIEPYMDQTYYVGKEDIVQALFGKTIAREFN